MTLLRSLVFDAFFYSLMLVMGILCLPLAISGKKGTYWSIHAYTTIVLAALRLICGLRTEVRGTPPTGEAIVASKHQSFLDILILANVLPEPKFVMKKSLRWAPILGFYAMRMGCAPVDRGKKGRAVQQMVQGIGRSRADGGQVIIYPQGTRLAPGVKAPYKVGAGVLYQSFGLPCVPVATNAGLFWGRMSLYRRPGLAVVEFLDPIEAGLDLRSFMTRLEGEIETASDALHEEGMVIREGRG
ncbi:MAG: lysophospholipid acyltransferase family protein [Rubricella sp.]